MKKTPIPNSFWVTRPPIDDLAKIQEYIRPCDPSTLLGFLPITPSIPSVEEEPQQHPSDSEIDPVVDELLETYGLTPEEFITSAINEPELWKEEELEKLLGVLSGDMPPVAIADIVREHMRIGGHRLTKQKAPTQIQSSDSDDELEELFPDRLEEPHHQMPGSFIDTSPIPGTANIGDWWLSKRKS